MNRGRYLVNVHSVGFYFLKRSKNRWRFSVKNHGWAHPMMRASCGFQVVYEFLWVMLANRYIIYPFLRGINGEGLAMLSFLEDCAHLRQPLLLSTSPPPSYLHPSTYVDVHHLAVKSAQEAAVLMLGLDYSQSLPFRPSLSSLALSLSVCTTA